MTLSDVERRERNNERQKKWILKNPEKAKETAKKSYDKHKKEISVRNKISRAKPEFKIKHKASMKIWHEKNKDRELEYRQERRGYTNLRTRTTRKILKNDILTHYSKHDFPECVCCGEKSNLIFLTIDHIKGRKDVNHKKRFAGKELYHFLKKNNYPVGYQTLCHNCNSAKSDSGMCPHQRKS